MNLPTQLAASWAWAWGNSCCPRTASPGAWGVQSRGASKLKPEGSGGIVEAEGAPPRGGQPAWAGRPGAGLTRPALARRWRSQGLEGREQGWQGGSWGLTPCLEEQDHPTQQSWQERGGAPAHSLPPWGYFLHRTSPSSRGAGSSAGEPAPCAHTETSTRVQPWAWHCPPGLPGPRTEASAGGVSAGLVGLAGLRWNRPGHLPELTPVSFLTCAL